MKWRKSKIIINVTNLLFIFSFRITGLLKKNNITNKEKDEKFNEMSKI